jgi:hypothetical protein
MTDEEALSEYDNRPALRARFFKFHRANPLIFHEIKKRAHEIKATGRSSYAIRTITESIRWDFDRQTTGDVFKLNDHYVPMYVRLLIGRYPEFDGLFELRAANGHGLFSEEERIRRAAAGLEDDDL